MSPNSVGGGEGLIGALLGLRKYCRRGNWDETLKIWVSERKIWKGLEADCEGKGEMSERWMNHSRCKGEDFRRVWRQMNYWGIWSRFQEAISCQNDCRDTWTFITTIQHTKPRDNLCRNYKTLDQSDSAAESKMLKNSALLKNYLSRQLGQGSVASWLLLIRPWYTTCSWIHRSGRSVVGPSMVIWEGMRG